MKDKKLIKNLQDLKHFYEMGIKQARIDNKKKEAQIMSKKIEELDELLTKYS